MPARRSGQSGRPPSTGPARSASQPWPAAGGRGRRPPYPEKVKLDKQFKYADKKQIPFAVIIGEKEMENKTCMVKDLKKGVQEEISFENLVNHVDPVRRVFLF